MLVWELGWTEKGEAGEPSGQQERPIGQGLTPKQNQAIEQIIDRYSRVFHEPQGLPPDRGMVHHIPLKEGTDPINVRPYRYPHIMKGEIEK